MTLGVDAITTVFHPDRCAIVTNIPMTNDHISSEGPCGDEPMAYASRGYGVGLNIGVTFLRHILFGGEVWAVGFGGRRSYDSTAASGIGAETTNSIAGSVYVGGITSPLGSAKERPGRKVWLGMLVGTSTWTGERTCIKCRFEPMKMGRPAFVEPFAMLGGGDKDGGGGFGRI